jgi:CheY-like chemotaxis protein
MPGEDADAGGSGPPKKCILFVEGDILVREPIVEFLRGCGYRVVGASSTDEAVQYVEAGHPVDVVLADAGSTGRLNGFELASWIRKLDIPVHVVLAGSVVQVAEKAGGLCEDSPQVSKPYHPQLLLRRIQSLVANRDQP